MFVQVADPVKQGFVASFSKPGGNLTGFSLFEFSLGGKWVGLLKNVVPDLVRVAVMFNPETSPQTRFFIPEIQSVAPSLGIQVILMPLRSVAEIEHTLMSFSGEANSGVILLADIFLGMHESVIAGLAGRYGLPAIGTTRGFVTAGGLMAYGNMESVLNQYRRAATYVDLILPVHVADQYAFVVNLKSAKALGVNVPPPLLVGADEIIE